MKWLGWRSYVSISTVLLPSSDSKWWKLVVMMSVARSVHLFVKYNISNISWHFQVRSWNLEQIFIVSIWRFLKILLTSWSFVRMTQESLNPWWLRTPPAKTKQKWHCSFYIYCHAALFWLHMVLRPFYSSSSQGNSKNEIRLVDDWFCLMVCLVLY